MESFSTNRSLSFVRQTFSDQTMDSNKNAAQEICSKIIINYKVSKAQTQSKFVNLLQSKRNMMLVSLL